MCLAFYSRNMQEQLIFYQLELNSRNNDVKTNPTCGELEVNKLTSPSSLLPLRVRGIFYHRSFVFWT